MASPLSTAAAPDRMAVYDRRAANALKNLGLRTATKKHRANVATLCEIVAELKEIVDQDWRPHDVDMALFMMGSWAGASTLE